MSDLTFQQLQAIGWKRSQAWSVGEPWDLRDWGIAVGGEAGEMLNVIKKMTRARKGMRGNTEAMSELQAKLRGEAADIVIYLASLAESQGWDLGDAVVEKFNLKSIQQGFKEWL